MAFDPKEHTIDPKSGFIVGKESGHPIGLVADPKLGVIPGAGAEYPKWIKVHDSWIVRLEGAPPVTPMLGHCHIDRGTGDVSVLVADEEEEKRAAGEMPKPEAAPAADMTQGERAAAMDEHERVTEMNMGTQGGLSPGSPGVFSPSAEIARDEAAIAEDRADIEKIEADERKGAAGDAAYLGDPSKKLN